MRTFSRTTQFKKDVKLADKRGKNLEKLKVVLNLLIDGGEVHSLTSQKVGIAKPPKNVRLLETQPISWC